ncbi:hypothetical protein [Halostagnicola sp. A-GB9-2]|uniref:hypothetical protein n=1 Tax=Halostagnicola sp. A-GB9-2 TaxID=3048066 RepID=UPI0024BFC1F1|nr:hypothetical protein [Halostagnicola sp. A-GB9-2]MDJ1434189.1 hypothetical protein [Halostagnicola sp. A-GB9-2]
MTAVVALPLVRSYYYLGEADALSHLGATRDIVWGNISMLEIRYPVIHTLSAISSDITGMGVTESLLLFVVVFVVTFFVFIPLTLKELTSNERIVLVGAFSGLLLLQLNFLGTNMQPHPASQAVMFAAAIVYLFVGYYRRSDRRFVIMILLAAAMFVLLHPQQAANFVIFFGTIATIQLLHTIGWRYVGLQLGPFVLPVAVIFGLLFWLWAIRLPAFESSLGAFITSLLVDTGTATQVTSRGVSLGAIGGSLEEVFLKLFLVALLYCILTGAVALAVTADVVRLPGTGRFRGIVTSIPQDSRTLLLYFIPGFVAVTGLFIGYIVGDLTSQYFRHFGFMMVIVTIMGATVLGRGSMILEQRFGRARGRSFSVVVVLSLLLLSMLVVFPSPYIYQTTGHVPESQMDGYERAFEYGHAEISYDHVRSSASRYGTAINGGAEQDRRDYYREGERRGGVPDHFNDHQLPEYFDEPVYLGVTGADRERDPGIYRGLRFTHDDFAYLENEPQINKVQSNGGFDLYLVQPADTAG